MQKTFWLTQTIDVMGGRHWTWLSDAVKTQIELSASPPPQLSLLLSGGRRGCEEGFNDLSLYSHSNVSAQWTG